MGVHPTYLSALLHGRKGRPSEKQIAAIANALKLSSRDLVSLTVAASDSFRTLELPNDANVDERRVAVRLVSAMGHLLPDQIRAINSILDLTPHPKQWDGSKAEEKDALMV
jgi:transcriptional regulator with XRE-family HTH domain